jgi:hypothetical protein
MHFARSESALALSPGPAFPAWLSPDGHLRVRRMVASGRWMRPVRALFSTDNPRVSYRS